jgi:hypothetical protein
MPRHPYQLYPVMFGQFREYGTAYIQQTFCLCQAFRNISRVTDATASMILQRISGESLTLVQHAFLRYPHIKKSRGSQIRQSRGSQTGVTLTSPYSCELLIKEFSDTCQKCGGGPFADRCSCQVPVAQHIKADSTHNCYFMEEEWSDHSRTD